MGYGWEAEAWPGCLFGLSHRVATDQVWLTHTECISIEQLVYVQARSTDKSVPSNSGGKKMLAVRNALDSDKEAVLQKHCRTQSTTRSTANLV